jgi:HSP20 family protein
MSDHASHHSEKEHKSMPAAWNPFLIPARNMNRVFWPLAEGFLRPGFFGADNMFAPWQRTFGHLMKCSPLSWGGAMTPSVDIVESDDSLKVKADLPGLSAEDVELTIAGGALTIAGEKDEDVTESDGNYLHRECMCGAFSRTIPLPPGVDTGSARATFDNNVLTVEIPKAEKADTVQASGTVRIPVQAAGKPKGGNGGTRRSRKPAKPRKNH